MSNMQVKGTVVTIIITVMIIGLLVWGASLRGDASMRMFPGTSVACLPNGHQQLAIHIHPRLSITVDGEAEVIPANVGIVGNCMSEIHTHDTSGELHVETATMERFEIIQFKHFFDVWGQDVEREGYDLQILVNGEPVDSVDDVPLRDRDVIEMIYTSQETV